LDSFGVVDDEFDPRQPSARRRFRAPVPDVDPVVLRIGQVDRLADVVVRRAVEAPPLLDPGQGVAERRPRGTPKRRVKESRPARGGPVGRREEDQTAVVDAARSASWSSVSSPITSA
jgi:hypothetical protein